MFFKIIRHIDKLFSAKNELDINNTASVEKHFNNMVSLSGKTGILGEIITKETYADFSILKALSDSEYFQAAEFVGILNKEQDSSKKQKKLGIITEFYKTNNFIAGNKKLRLWDHALIEWTIINKFINNKAVPVELFAVPARHNQTILKNYFSTEGQAIIKNIDFNNNIKQLLKYFLLLHDIGKYPSCDNTGHEKLSAEYIKEIDFKGILAPLEKEILSFMSLNHTKFEDAAQDSILKKELVEFFKNFSKKKALSIMKLWVLFRIAERIGAECFGYIDDQFLRKITTLHNTLNKEIQ